MFLDRAVRGRHWSYLADSTLHLALAQVSTATHQRLQDRRCNPSEVDVNCFIFNAHSTKVMDNTAFFRVLTTFARLGYDFEQVPMDWKHFWTIRCTNSSVDPSQKWVRYNFKPEIAFSDWFVLVNTGGVTYVNTSSSWELVNPHVAQFQASLVTVTEVSTWLNSTFVLL